KLPKLQALAEVVVAPGGKTQLKVSVDRQGYEGIIEVQLEGLPDGVKCGPAFLLPDQSSIPVELTAAADTREGEKYVDLFVLTGGRKTDRQVTTLVVRKPPPLVKKSPREEVVFHSTDGVRLTGTWYPGIKGRGAPCVLLLQDIGAAGTRAGWEHLAEKLQE